MQQKITVRKLKNRNHPIGIIKIKGEGWSKEQAAEFIKQWEAATAFNSPLKTIVLNDERVEWMGNMRKRSRLVSSFMAWRKLLSNKIINN